MLIWSSPITTTNSVMGGKTNNVNSGKSWTAQNTEKMKETSLKKQAKNQKD